MEYQLKPGPVKIDEWVGRHLESKVDHLGRRIRRYDHGGHALSVGIDQDPKGQWHVDLHLPLTGQDLHSRRHGADLYKVINKAMDGIFRSFDRWRIRHHPGLRLHIRRRQDRQAGVQAPQQGDDAGAPDEQDFRRLYQKLLNLATFEISAGQTDGALEPGFIDPAELADDIFLQYLPGLKEKGIEAIYDDHTLRGMQRALQQRIHHMVQEVEEALRTEVHTDEPATEPGALEMSDYGDEVLDFWVMDEKLLMEDVLPDPASHSPEGVVQDKESRRVLLQALLQVPADSRYIVSSLLMEDDDPGDVAGFLGQSEEEVQTGLEQALTALAEHLSGPAVTFSHDEVAALYRELGERFAVDVSHLTRYCQ